MLVLLCAEHSETHQEAPTPPPPAPISVSSHPPLELARLLPAAAPLLPYSGYFIFASRKMKQPARGPRGDLIVFCNIALEVDFKYIYLPVIDGAVWKIPGRRGGEDRPSAECAQCVCG